jgi:bla regulator protein BlaR1
VTGQLVDTLISVSMLLLLVLALRGPVARQFGARAAYALWLAPLARLVAPLLTALVPASETTAGTIGGAMPEIVVMRLPAASGFAWASWILALWVAGVLIFLAVQLARHQLFLRQALSNGTTLTLPRIAFDVVASKAVDGPMATGLIHPVILVPADFATRFSAQQQRLALLHEQLHHRRGDIWASAAALIVTALLWFNPIAHLALGAFRRDMEAACDSAVLARVRRDEARVYAETILRSAMRPVPRSLCALTAIDELKGRLAMLNLTHGRGRKLAGIIVAGAVSLAGLTLAVPAQGAPDSETRTFEKKIVIHERSGDKDVLVRNDGEPREIKCDGERFEAGASGGSADKTEQIKFFICAKPGESLLPALEKAEADLQKSDDMPPERKSEILTQIRSKIAELRARG